MLKAAAINFVLALANIALAVAIGRDSWSYPINVAVAGFCGGLGVMSVITWRVDRAI